MEALIVLVFFGALLPTLLVLVVVAFVRSRAVGPLKRRVDELERQVARLGGGVAPEPARSHATPEPEVEPPARAAPVVAPAPAAGVGARPSETEPPARVSQRPPRVEPVVPAPRRAPIEWERWIGVRGAALLGGVFLALAGLLFFQYSIQRGWITPALRVSIGTLVGLCAVAASRPLRGRGYRITADALAGSGAVILYGATWAAHVLYGLVSAAPALVAMAGITLGGGWLAQRHRSLPIAVFALVGGMATPLLLSLGVDHPLGLFGYLLLLDLGIVIVGGRLRRPLLAGLGVLGTLVVQGIWIAFHLDGESFHLALFGLAASAAVFAASGRGRDWLLPQAGAILLPLPFVAFFASRVRLEPHLLPMGLLLAALVAGAAWIARRESAPWLGSGAAAGCVATLAVWVASSVLDAALAWELVGVAVGLAGIGELFVARGAAPSGQRATAVTRFAGLAGCLVFALAVAPDLPPWPLLAGLAALALLGARNAARTSWTALLAVGTPSLALGWLVHRVSEASASCAHLTPVAEASFVVGLAALSVLSALALRKAELRVGARCAATVAALVLLAATIGRDEPTVPQLVASAGLGLAAVTAAGLAGAPRFFATALALTLLLQLRAVSDVDTAGSGPLALLGLFGLEVALFTSWPLTLGRKLRAHATAWSAAIAAPVLAYAVLEPLHEAGLSGRFPGSLALALAVLVGLVVFLAAAKSAPVAARAGYTTVAVGFAAFALPVELDRAVWVVGSALFAVGVAATWRRFRLPALRGLSATLVALSSLGLGLHTLVLLEDPARYELTGWPVLHWISYVWCVPALAALLAARVLRGRLGAASGLVGLLLLFLWINLEILNLFGGGPVLDVSFQRDPVRDLVTSLVWGLYAVTLLGLGVSRVSVGLRWVSLAFLLATIGKVFLYDLGKLEGLYRVSSLIGLAFSLLLVSLVYQRFVFRPVLRPAGS